MSYRINNNIIQKFKKTGKIALRAVAVLFVCLGVFFAFDLDSVIARYFMRDKADEVVNANSFYFTSDHLSPAEYDGSIAEYVMSGWDGMSKKSFAFNIRNYDNPLLYNNEKQNVKYEMEYEILNGDDKYVDVHIYRLLNGKETEELNGILYGEDNTFSSNEYKLSFTSKNPSSVISHDITVLLTVRTVEAPYYAELKTKVTLQYTQFKDFIAYQGVSTEEDNEKVVSLIYDINTANKIDTSEMENTDIAIATQTVHIEWDNSLVEFHEFDKKVDEVFSIKTLNEVLAEYDDISKCKHTIIIDETNNIGHIYFDALAYSAYEIIFHKRIESWTDKDFWKDSNGTWLWELSPAPIETGTIIFAEALEHNITD